MNINITIGVMQSAGSMLIKTKAPNIRKGYFGGKKVRSLDSVDEAGDSEYAIEFNANDSSMFVEMFVAVSRKSSIAGLSRYKIASNAIVYEEEKQEEQYEEINRHNSKYTGMPLVADVLKDIIPQELFNKFEKLPYNKLVNIIEEHAIDIAFMNILYLHIPESRISKTKIARFLEYILQIKTNRVQKIFFMLPLDICLITLQYIPTHLFIKMHGIARKSIYTNNYTMLTKNNVQNINLFSSKEYNIRKLDCEKLINQLYSTEWSVHKKISDIVKEIKVYESPAIKIKLEYLPYLIEKIYLQYKNSFSSTLLKVLGVCLTPVISPQYWGYTKKSLDTLYVEDYKREILKQDIQKLQNNVNLYTNKNEVQYTAFAISAMKAKLAFILHFTLSLPILDSVIFFNDIAFRTLESLYKNCIYYLFLHTQYNIILTLKGMEFSANWLIFFDTISLDLVKRLYLLAVMLPSYEDKELGLLFKDIKSRIIVSKMSNQEFLEFLNNVGKIKNTKALALILQRTLSL